MRPPKSRSFPGSCLGMLPGSSWKKRARKVDWVGGYDYGERDSAWMEISASVDRSRVLIRDPSWTPEVLQEYPQNNHTT